MQCATHSVSASLISHQCSAINTGVFMTWRVFDRGWDGEGGGVTAPFGQANPHDNANDDENDDGDDDDDNNKHSKVRSLLAVHPSRNSWIWEIRLVSKIEPKVPAWGRGVGLFTIPEL